MAKYTPEDKARALAALMASAEMVDGEMVPNFRAVASQSDMPADRTLSRWWSERDVSRDVELRRATLRAREKAREEGAEDWMKAKVAQLQEGMDFILHPDHRTRQTIVIGTDRDGQPIMGESYPVRPDQMSRAYKDALFTLKGLQELMAGGGGRDRGQRLRRLRESVRRVGLASAKAAK